MLNEFGAALLDHLDKRDMTVPGLVDEMEMMIDSIEDPEVRAPVSVGLVISYMTDAEALGHLDAIGYAAMANARVVEGGGGAVGVVHHGGGAG